MLPIWEQDIKGYHRRIGIRSRIEGTVDYLDLLDRFRLRLPALVDGRTIFRAWKLKKMLMW